MIAKPSPLLSLETVNYAIDDTLLVKEISFVVRPFELVSIIGPNGAGKSTLVKLVLGLIKPSSGTLKNTATRISYVPQKFAITSVLPLQVKNLLDQANKTALTATERCTVYDMLSILPLLDSQMSVLSGGELQRVLLARALLNKPDLLVLDEPMQGLDPDAQTQLYGLIDALPDFLRCAILVVSHDLHWVMRGTKQVICLNKHICCQGTPADIQYHPEFLALFGTHFGSTEALIAPYIHHHNHCHHDPI